MATNVTIEQWLTEIGLGQLAPDFARNHIDWDVLGELDDKDLESLGLTLGQRRRLLKALRGVNESTTTSAWTSANSIPRTQAERRQLSVLFCDLVGSTALSNQLDPEDLRDVIQHYQDAVAEAVARFDGHVARFLGDGILIYFGWPWAYEDQAERSIWSGLAAVSAVEAISRYEHLGLQARVGIASGEVVIGDLVGQAGRDAEAATGETPNLAARLQSLAEPGQVVIDPATLALTGTTFVTDAMGRFDLKGFPEPVPVWRVIGGGGAESRYDAAGRTGATTLIGREQEFLLLEQAWRKTREGIGQTVFVSGEAGIGKSRLISEFSDSLKDEARGQLRLQCSPYHTGTALYPAIARMEREARFAPGDDAQTRLQKLEDLFRQPSGDVHPDVNYFAAMLSLPAEERYRLLPCAGNQLRERTIRALVAQVIERAGAGPMLVKVEDAHWIDPTTEALVESLAAASANTPVMLVVSHRSTYVPPALAPDRTSAIELSRLSPEASLALARAIGGERLTETVAEHIVERTGGIPLYVEEVAKTVAQSKDQAATVIPASLHALLVGRIDRLGDAAQIAQIAATIGRSFEFELIAALGLSEPRALYDGLAAMTSADIVSCSGTPPHSRYSFRHALVQDAAYHTLLKSTRQKIHGRIADVLIGRLESEQAPEPEVIARHLSAATQPQRAVAYWLLAGRRAGERSSHDEAIANFRHALAATEHVDEAELRDEYEFSIRLALGASLLTVKGWTATEVETNYERARELSTAAGDTREAFVTLRGLANVFFLRGQVAKARELADRQLAIARDHADQTLRMGALRAVGMCSFFAGEFAEARRLLHESVALYQPERDGELRFIEGTDPAVISYSVLSWAEWMVGNTEAAKLASRKAVRIAGSLDHPFSIAYARCLAASFHQFCREPDLVTQHCEEALAVADRFDYQYWRGWALALKGWATATYGNAEVGLESLLLGRRIYTGTGALQLKPYLDALVAEVHRRQGDPAAGLDAIRTSFGEGNVTDVSFYEAEARRISASLKHLNGDTELEAELELAFNEAQGQGATALALRIAIDWLELSRAIGTDCTVAADRLAATCRQFDANDSSQELAAAKRQYAAIATARN